VTEALQNSGDVEVRASAAELTDLRKARWKADYDMEDAEVEHERTVRKVVARAKQCIKQLDACVADESRRRVVSTGIRRWAGSAAGASKGFTLK
jgi:hypothetical protein